MCLLSPAIAYFHFFQPTSPRVFPAVSAPSYPAGGGSWEQRTHSKSKFKNILVRAFAFQFYIFTIVKKEVSFI